MLEFPSNYLEEKIQQAQKFGSVRKAMLYTTCLLSLSICGRVIPIHGALINALRENYQPSKKIVVYQKSGDADENCHLQDTLCSFVFFVCCFCFSRYGFFVQLWPSWNTLCRPGQHQTHSSPVASAYCLAPLCSFNMNFGVKSDRGQLKDKNDSIPVTGSKQCCHAVYFNLERSRPSIVNY